MKTLYYLKDREGNVRYIGATSRSLKMCRNTLKHTKRTSPIKEWLNAIDYIPEIEAVQAFSENEADEAVKTEIRARLAEGWPLLNTPYKVRTEQERAEHEKRWDQINNSRRKAVKRQAFVENVRREVLFLMFDGICYLCDSPIDPNSDWHIDHIQPLSRGGKHSYDNTAPTHFDCNVLKADLTLQELSERKMF